MDDWMQKHLRSLTAKKRFNPSQPRDSHGRWSALGAVFGSLMEKTNQDNMEHGAWLDEKGKIIRSHDGARTSNPPYHVIEMGEAPVPNSTSIHTHPVGFPAVFSAGDLKSFDEDENERRMIVLSRDGWSEVSKPTSYHHRWGLNPESKWNYHAATLEKKVHEDIVKGASEEEARTNLYREATRRTAKDFGWILSEHF